MSITRLGIPGCSATPPDPITPIMQAAERLDEPIATYACGSHAAVGDIVWSPVFGVMVQVEVEAITRGCIKPAQGADLGHYWWSADRFRLIRRANPFAS